MATLARRALLGAGGLAVTGPQTSMAGISGRRDHGAALQSRVLAKFRGLPGTRAFKFWAPATASEPEVLITDNADQQLFIGSAFKAFVLCERLRQLDAPDVLAKITTQQLVLDESVWSADSATFNPPNLSGKVSERTAMEAMILHSDNTGTDMVLGAAGPDRVRSFLAAADMHDSLIPESTRAFFGYLLGAQDYKTFSWAELIASGDLPIVNSPLNDLQTLASSANDLVSFYARSVQGEFFQHEETLRQFRNVLSLGDVINLVLPLGGSAFAKGGSIDVSGFHALCAPGAAFVGGRWLYFAMIINWYAATETDPATVARYLAAARAALTEVYSALG